MMFLRSILVYVLAIGFTLTNASAWRIAARPAALAQDSGSMRLSPEDTSLNLDAVNYSRDALLTTYTWPDLQVANAVLMKFDLSILPADAFVTTATLHLALVESDAATDPAYTVSVHKVLGRSPVIATATGFTADGVTGWTPNTCCDNGVPLAQADISAAYDQRTVDKSPGLKTWTLTTMVQEWLADPSSNRGLLLNSDSSKPRDRYRFFASMEHPSVSLRPYLEIAFRAGDATPPSVRMTAPSAGATLSDRATLSAAASDNVRVESVQFQLDGASLGPALTSAPYTFDWDTTAVADGTHALRAVARDWAGNVTTATAITVTTRNGVLLLSPEDTWINLNATNYGTDTRLRTYTWPDNKAANAVLLKFNLSSVPAGANVTSATLQLALVESDSAADATYSIGAHKLLRRNPVIAGATGQTADGTTAWSPSTCCYNNVPLAQADISPPYDVRAVGKSAGPVAWTITTLVREWLTDPASNFGVLLNADTSKPRDRYRYFASMEHTDTSVRPLLRITLATAPSDTTAPTISITAPTSGSTVSGTVAVTASASDNVGVTGVQFKVDGANLGAEDTSAPYSISWNTATMGNGSHTLTAVARDAAGNQKTSASITVTASNAAPPPPPPTGGIAAQYPGDAGIEGHPDVIFVERFEQATTGELFNRWADVRNGSSMSFTADVPPRSPGSRSLNIPWTGGGVNDGGHLFRQVTPGVDDTLYVRYYIKYPTSGSYDHTGIWMGGQNPPLAWPNPQAGTRPVGNDRFIAAAEQNTQTARFDHYNYWMTMHQSADGNYWGNLLLNNPNVQARTGGWTCVEHMVKLNNPTTAFNGEHAIWLDGVKVSHLGQGFPRGTWSGGIFTQNSSGSPFEGFRWRSDVNLKLNWIWLQVYAPDSPAGFNSSIRFDHVVVARSYVGCLAGGSSDTTAPVVSVTAPSNGATVSGTVTASANASDNVGVAGVQFKLDGANLGAEDTTAPYSTAWNTTTASAGSHTLTAVARDGAGNSATSASVAVTVNNGGGSPVGWPNEPAGLTVRTDWGLDQSPPASGDVSIPGSPGWKIVGNAASGSAQGWAARVSDASAPFSPSNVYDFVYPQGMVEGEAPATVYYSGLSADEVYAGFWWKPSSPFDTGPNGNKIAFIFNGGGGAGGQQFLILRPDRRLHVLPEYPGDFQWRTPNVNGTVVTLGVWHRIEWYTNRLTGTLKWWLDGVLQGSYTNVTNATRFDMFQFSPTWGGNIGARKAQTDHYWFDHVHLSAR
jgi:hypothetical protein